MPIPLYSVSDEVTQAIRDGKPVVALESTVISHGLPFPENLQAAVSLEGAVRAEGGVPATIYIRDGRIIVGATKEQLEALAKEAHVKKLNLSNLGVGVASQQAGSTTVAATMHIAHAVGIRVFGTGGIGGVHRGATESFDISADLAALSRYPVAVVAAGAKAILDLGKTVEMLETLGVPVLGWQTYYFPAFYRRKTELPVDARYDLIDDLARAVDTHWELGFKTGILVANPVPKDKQMDKALYEDAIESALASAAEHGVTGREVTPYLLDAMRKATEGQSVFTNLALLQSNATVAAKLAKAIHTR